MYYFLLGVGASIIIMDPSCSQYPLTNINLHVRYGSNLIMPFKIQRTIILFGGNLGNLLLHPGVPKDRLSIDGIQMEI